MCIDVPSSRVDELYTAAVDRYKDGILDIINPRIVSREPPYLSCYFIACVLCGKQGQLKTRRYPFFKQANLSQRYHLPQSIDSSSSVAVLKGLCYA